MAKVKPPKRAVRYPHAIGLRVDDATLQKILDRRLPNEPVAEATRRLLVGAVEPSELPETAQKSIA